MCFPKKAKITNQVGAVDVMPHFGLGVSNVLIGGSDSTTRARVATGLKQLQLPVDNSLRLQTDPTTNIPKMPTQSKLMINQGGY